MAPVIGMVFAQMDGMRRTALIAIAVGAIAVSAASSCTKRSDTDGVAAALQSALAGAVPRGISKDIWQSAARFYAARENAPAWVSASAPGKRSAAAIASFDTARAHALDPAAYGAPDLLAE